LDTLLNQAVTANHQKKTKALKYLICAEHNCQCYAQFQQHTKPKASGRLVFVTVTNAQGEKQPLLKCNELEDTLLEYSHTHFAHAEGSKFMQEPLSQLLQYNWLTPFGDMITQGQQVDSYHNFDEPTKAIFQHLN